MRGLRAAVRRRRAFGGEDVQEVLGRAGRGGLRAPRRRPVELDERVVSGRRRQPAVGVVGQLRRRRHDRRRAGDRRDRLHERSVDAPREGDLHRRRAAVPGRALDFDGRKAYVRAVECDYYTDAITYTKVTILDTFANARAVDGGADADEPEPVPSPGRHGEVHVVSRVVGFKKIKFYTNENVGSGRARSARAADAHVVVLADDSGGGDGGAAVRRRRPARRRRRPGVRDAQRRAAAADVRRPRHRPVGRRRRARAATTRTAGGAAAAERSPPSRTSSSTTTIPAASASAAAVRHAPALLLERTRELIAAVPARRAARRASGPEGNTGPHAKRWRRGSSQLTAARRPRPESSARARLRATSDRSSPPAPPRRQRSPAARELTYEPDDGGYEAALDLDRAATIARRPPVTNASASARAIDRRYESDRWHGDVQIGDCELDDFDALRCSIPAGRRAGPNGARSSSISKRPA